MIIYVFLSTFLRSFVLGSSGSEYYACPMQSICVAPALCPSENITYNAFDPPEDPLHKYVCGLFPECEGCICCNDPIGASSSFVPTMTKWYYSEETSEDASGDAGSVPVYPYPGLEMSAEASTEDKPNDLVCPPSSECVKAFTCLPGDITFFPGFSERNYTCGAFDTAGHLCCLKTGIITTRPEIKPKLQKLFSRKERSSSEEDDFNLASEVLPVRKEKFFAKWEKLHKEMTGRSSSEDEWDCGRSLSISRELLRIYSPIGERTAEEGHYPWHVAILSSTYEYLCSGVIVGEKFVLTIAHCFDKNNSASNLLVRVGDLNLKLESEKNTAFDVRVNLLVIHPDYDKVKLKADIAVLELQHSVRGIQHVRPACLPLSKYRPSINRCKVPGWGQYTQSNEPKNDEFSYELRESSFYIIEKRRCQNELRKAKELGPFFKLQDDVLCAKGYSNADTCKGDGGSGLVCRDKDIFILKGLVSYGVGCGFNLPGVYTDIEAYLDFIQSYKSHSFNQNVKAETNNGTINNPSINERVDVFIGSYFPDDPYYEGPVVEYFPDDPYYEGPVVEYFPDDPYYEGPVVEYFPDDLYYEGPVVEYFPDDPYYEGFVDYFPDDPYYEGFVDYFPDHPYYAPVKYFPDSLYYKDLFEYFPHDSYKRAEYKYEHPLHKNPKRNYAQSIFGSKNPEDYEYNSPYIRDEHFPVNKYDRADEDEEAVHSYKNIKKAYEFDGSDYGKDYLPSNEYYGQKDDRAPLNYESAFEFRPDHNYVEDAVESSSYENTGNIINGRLYYGGGHSSIPGNKKASRGSTKNPALRRRKIPEIFSKTLASLSRYQFPNDP